MKWGLDLKTALTALVSVILGGLTTTGLVYLGVLGTLDDLIKTVNSLKPGETLNLTVVTPGEEPRDVKVSVGARPDEQ